ncbi:hypothetical protein SAMN05444280_13325 [Tangfeifania diversioriginum]|uniref:Uncharacterized protein n=1 Tax=Tangfeifania diversioriginum TaxID=1168035 RepID=A0A1M6MJ64_9BACT|nr:hypothetical protein [Tangfeifania diversioriginum]SHJ83323.1 hypothetical protein SAMN05444280_13325 [Tangfeifania diversioriginum]
METTIRINSNEITPELIEGIKKLFPNKTIEINIQPADTTDYILSNPEYVKVLEERIAQYENKKKTISVKASDLV